jgi:hypothetical protein
MPSVGLVAWLYESGAIILPREIKVPAARA